MGLDQFFLTQRTRKQTRAILAILLFYTYSLRASDRNSDADALQARFTPLFGKLPPVLEAKLRTQEIYGIWYTTDTQAAVPKIHDFLRQYPEHPQAYVLRQKLALQQIGTGDYQAALDTIRPALRFEPNAVRSEFYLHYPQDMRYLQGYCLVQLGQTTQGQTLLSANAPTPALLRSLPATAEQP